MQTHWPIHHSKSMAGDAIQAAATAFYRQQATPQQFLIYYAIFNKQVIHTFDCAFSWPAIPETLYCKEYPSFRTNTMVGSSAGAPVSSETVFPAPATSNVACRFPALRSPNNFVSSLIRLTHRFSFLRGYFKVVIDVIHSK
jgi:hypothetical protein